MNHLWHFTWNDPYMNVKWGLEGGQEHGAFIYMNTQNGRNTFHPLYSILFYAICKECLSKGKSSL